jgi:PAS domain S-box-containing protein
MSKPSRPPSAAEQGLTGRLVGFPDDEIIVSKTDLRGILTYVNDVFIRVSGYSEEELIGAPHRILRHPEMPRAVFKLLWDTISAEREIFAYVLNRAKSGDEYWVFAHVTPSFDRAGNHVGYHSSRRSAYLDALPKVKRLYAQVLEVERPISSSAEAARAGMAFLNDVLAERGMSYDQFVFGLSEQTQLSASLK